MKIDELENVDAVVIGAGPAGLSCVKELLRNDKRVLLIFPGNSINENVGGLASQWHSQCAVLQENDLRNPDFFLNWPITHDEYFQYIKEVEKDLEIESKKNNFSKEILNIENGKRSINQVKTIIGTKREWADIFAKELSNPYLTKFNGEVISILHDGLARGVFLKNGKSFLFDAKVKVYLAAGCEKNTQILSQSNFEVLNNSNAFGKYLADHPMFENYVLEGGNRKRFFELFENGQNSGQKYKRKIKYEVIVNSKILGVFEIRHFYTKRSIGDGRKMLSPFEIIKMAVNRFTQKCLKQIIFKPLQSRLWIQIAQELNSDSKFIIGQKDFHAVWELGENDLKNYRELVTTANLLLRQWDFSLKEIKIVKSLEDLKESAIPAYHPSGTTRAHQSPEFGVVDSIGKVNGCDNLFICGSSVFTTPGWVNPTLTIMALSTRTARLSS
jgi:hypothetical protein